MVIDDPHVAPQHVLVERDDNGALVAEDLGTANGLFADRGTRKLKRIDLDGERLIRIGHTDLRIPDANYAVTPERVSGFVGSLPTLNRSRADSTVTEPKTCRRV